MRNHTESWAGRRYLRLKFWCKHLTLKSDCHLPKQTVLFASMEAR